MTLNNDFIALTDNRPLVGFFDDSACAAGFNLFDTAGFGLFQVSGNSQVNFTAKVVKTGANIDHGVLQLLRGYAVSLPIN